jgi:lysophospholipase L1-like esterase
VAALGDSLSTGFDACDHYGDCPAASWATGTDDTVHSIAARLREQTGAKVTVHGDARAGASVDDLPRQVDLAIAQRPTLVTLLIGGNDVCRATVPDMTPAATFGDTVGGQLQRLATALPDATILVASVPDVTDLLPVAAPISTARFLWSTVGGCGTVLDAPLATDPAAEQRRAAVRQRIDDYDRTLESACAAIRTCVYDGGALHDYQPTVAQLSPLDYFHPSVAGLREIAALEWAALQRGT